MTEIIEANDRQESNYDINSVNLAEIKCESCELIFGIIDSYIGIITCPYCNEYVEG
ncbi:hypothetical protein MASR1M45_09760 [Candidatus Kapaibacterium sp.]